MTDKGENETARDQIYHDTVMERDLWRDWALNLARAADLVLDHVPGAEDELMQARFDNRRPSNRPIVVTPS